MNYVAVCFHTANLADFLDFCQSFPALHTFTLFYYAYHEEISESAAFPLSPCASSIGMCYDADIVSNNNADLSHRPERHEYDTA